MRVAPQTVPALAETCTYYFHDPTTAVLASVMESHADPDGVRLAWAISVGPGAAVTIYRRETDQAWLAVGQTATDSEGRIRYEDRSTQPGHRYGYRLGVQVDGAEEFVGEVWVDVPAEFRLALERTYPNPADRELNVAFSLPASGPARLELLDVAGRRVLSREVGRSQRGRGELRLPLAGGLPAGIYVVRLTQSGHAATTKACLIR
jgi:hypothetical protein